MKGQPAGKPVIVGVGLFVHGTGFTRVLASLFERLSDHFSIHWLGIGYKGAVTQSLDYTLHPCNLHGGDIYGAYGAVALAEEVNAQTIFLLNDLYMLKNYQQAWEPLQKKNIRLLVYAPLDGTITNPDTIKDCFFPDDLVLYNQWAMQEVKTAMEKHKSQHNDEKLSIPSLHFIYHGVDRHKFHPPADAAEQKKLKEQLFNVPGAANSIFILNANRYNERKDIETTIAAFAEALPHFNKPAYLFLHTPNTDPPLKTGLETVIGNSGCRSSIILNPLGEDYSDDDELMKLYQACAIGINTSLGEGWGMISFEHAACGAAQIVPDHTAPAEIWKDAAILIPIAGPVQLPSNPLLMYASNKVSISKALIRLVNDENYLAAVADACCSRAKEEAFNWDKIAREWEELLLAKVLPVS